MADAILDLSALSTPSTGGLSAPTASGASCPILYPTDSLAINTLQYIPPGASSLPGSASAGTTCPPGALSGYLTDLNDTLRFSTLVTSGPKTVTFYGTTISPTGQLIPFSQDVTGNSSSTASIKYLRPGPGIVQGVGVTAVGGIGAATIYVLVEIGNLTNSVFTPRVQLLSGLLTGFGVANNVVDTTQSGGGGGGGGTNCCGTMELFFWDFTLSDDLQISPGTNRHRIHSLAFTFFSGAAAVNHKLNISIYDLSTGGDLLAQIIDNTTFAANATIGWTVAVGAATIVDVQGSGVEARTLPLPDLGPIGDNYQISLAVSNPQADDAFDAGHAAVEVIT